MNKAIALYGQVSSSYVIAPKSIGRRRSRFPEFFTIQPGGLAHDARLIRTLALRVGGEYSHRKAVLMLATLRDVNELTDEKVAELLDMSSLDLARYMSKVLRRDAVRRTVLSQGNLHKFHSVITEGADPALSVDEVSSAIVDYRRNELWGFEAHGAESFFEVLKREAARLRQERSNLRDCRRKGLHTNSLKLDLQLNEIIDQLADIEAFIEAHAPVEDRFEWFQTTEADEFFSRLMQGAQELYHNAVAARIQSFGVMSENCKAALVQARDLIAWMNASNYYFDVQIYSRDLIYLQTLDIDTDATKWSIEE